MCFFCVYWGHRCASVCNLRRGVGVRWSGGGEKRGGQVCHGAQFRLTANLNLITGQTLKAQHKQQEG